MPDKNIGALPQAAQLDDDSLLVVEQQGQAMKMTGAQFKEFGKQAVIGQVQGYVDAAEAAAAQAVGAVSAVTDMTVEAQTLASGQSASVTKTMKGGTVNLAFGLPRGERGEAGPEGQAGPRGPKGDPGNGLTILGYYDTLAELEAAVPSPGAGDAYGVGPEAPYDIYVYDGVSGAWKNNGPLSGGGGGGPLPENVVTSEGGASLEVPAGFGEAPHVISFDDEEELPITAEDVAYSDTQTVKDAIDGLKSSVSNGKALVASAITDKGVPTAQDATFAKLAENIGQIASGSDTSDATATPGDILAPKTAYTAAGKVEGIIPTLAARTITPGTADQTIANGQYLSGTQTIKGDPNLASANIKSGVSIFGVNGALESAFQATLTVTADVGAMVSATHTNGTELEALSTTGAVTLELPMEGQWTVTARRGTAQYNSVVINVSSSYSAELTAEVHIEYFSDITPLSKRRGNFAAATVGNYAIFAGGSANNSPNSSALSISATADSYDGNFTLGAPSSLSTAREALAAATVGEYALFGGGRDGNGACNTIDAYNRSLTHTSPTRLSINRSYLSAASIGEYALFGGGDNSSVVDAYNTSLTHSTPTGLLVPSYSLAAASNDSYALFGGGFSSGAAIANVVAYNSSLTRTIASGLSFAKANLCASRAGSYVLFSGGGGSRAVDAYDLFLTRTNPESLGVSRWDITGTTLNGFSILAGGMVGNSETTSASFSNAVDVYDPYLIRSTVKVIGERKAKMAAVSIGNYALFGGGVLAHTGVSSPRRSNVVSVYHYV